MSPLENSEFFDEARRCIASLEGSDFELASWAAAELIWTFGAPITPLLAQAFTSNHAQKRIFAALCIEEIHRSTPLDNREFNDFYYRTWEQRRNVLREGARGTCPAFVAWTRYHLMWFRGAYWFCESRRIYEEFQSNAPRWLSTYLSANTLLNIEDDREWLQNIGWIHNKPRALHRRELVFELAAQLRDFLKTGLEHPDSGEFQFYATIEASRVQARYKLFDNDLLVQLLYYHFIVNPHESINQALELVLPHLTDSQRLTRAMLVGAIADPELGPNDTLKAMKKDRHFTVFSEKQLRYWLERFGISNPWLELDDVKSALDATLLQRLNSSPTLNFNAQRHGSGRAWLNTVIRNNALDVVRRHLGIPRRITAAAETTTRTYQPYVFAKRLGHDDLDLPDHRRPATPSIDAADLCRSLLSDESLTELDKLLIQERFFKQKTFTEILQTIESHPIYSDSLVGTNSKSKVDKLRFQLNSVLFALSKRCRLIDACASRSASANAIDQSW
jgi:hypothetical protein